MQLFEDPDEDRDEEEEHPDQDERREDEHDDRVGHRALHPPPDRLRLLDLQRDAVEDDVEHAGRLARLDHGDVEPAEDLRMPLHRLGEQQTALDVFPKRADHVDEVRVRRLLLEDEERGDDVHARLDHRRELAREDLQRLRLDALEVAHRLVLGRLALDLVQLVGEQSPLAEQVGGRRVVGCVERAVELEALGVDGGVGEGRH